MTNSETQFRNWIKKIRKGACIKKIPDFKQMGAQGVVGLPDYVVFSEGSTEWWEVKFGFGDTLNFKNHFTPGQKVVFKQMLDQGIDVNVWAKSKSKGFKIIPFSEILDKTFIKFE